MRIVYDIDGDFYVYKSATIKSLDNVKALIKHDDNWHWDQGRVNIQGFIFDRDHKDLPMILDNHFIYHFGFMIMEGAAFISTPYGDFTVSIDTENTFYRGLQSLPIDVYVHVMKTIVKGR